MNYDVIVIGGGGGGYPGAFRLSDSGLSVALIDDKGELGGNCLYSGCIPSKTVREIAQTVMRVRRILGQRSRPTSPRSKTTRTGCRRRGSASTGRS